MCVVLESRYARTSVCLCVERRERKGHVDVGIEVHLCVCECVKFSGFCRVYVRHIYVFIFTKYMCVCFNVSACEFVHVSCVVASLVRAFSATTHFSSVSLYAC